MGFRDTDQVPPSTLPRPPSVEDSEDRAEHTRSRPSRKAWRGPLVALAAVVVALAIAEGLARAYYALTRDRQAEGGSFNSYHKNIDKPTFVHKRDGDKTVASINPERAHEFHSLTFTVEKAKGTRRVFCLGGSTVYGADVPPSETFPARLQDLLASQYSHPRVEVVNVGREGSGTTEIGCTARDIVPYAADLWIIYTGHNEYLNFPLRFLSKTQRRVERSFLGKSRLVQLVADRSGSLKRAESTTERIRNFCREQAQILRECEANLRQIARLARQAGARLVLVSPLSNLKARPFSAAHFNELTQNQRLTFSGLYGQGQSALMPRPRADRDKRLRRARSFFGLALKVDETHAGAHYLLARTAEALGNYDLAKLEYQTAIDLDAAPQRAKSELLAGLEEVARETGAVFVDLRPWFESASPNGIWGGDLFVDHLHLNERGHAFVAKALSEAIVSGNLLD